MISSEDLSTIEIVKSEEQIQGRVKELAQEIDRDFKGEDIVVIGILKGSFIFFSDLIRQMKSEMSCEFFGTSDYEESPIPSGEVKIILDLNSPISGKNVLLVEDIVLDALTLNYLSRNILAREPKILKTCCFIKKISSSTKTNVSIDYIGFELSSEDRIVGYGMDYNGRFRNLPYVAKIKTS